MISFRATSLTLFCSLGNASLPVYFKPVLVPLTMSVTLKILFFYKQQQNIIGKLEHLDKACKRA